MRLWSINPKYLDRQGLLAVWREGLLALKVLKGETKGYRQHPQLERFKTKNGIKYINEYLYYIWCEACNRGYNFNLGKIVCSPNIKKESLKVTNGQLEYEFKHLQKKLYIRDRNKFNQNLKIENIEATPMFDIIEGDIESWEKIQ